MSLHYLDPSDEPRECPGCPVCLKRDAPERFDAREWCDGTGRLGNPEGPRVEVFERMRTRANGCDCPVNELTMQITGHDCSPGWSWALCGTPRRGEQLPHGGPYPTEEAALEAARAAHREAQR